ncbi:MAG: LysR family transcriptional regulator [Rhodospirillales bacterium]
MDPSKLVEMNAFAAVVEAGSFTGAAGAKGLSKAALSRHVAQLEDRLGLRLLNRTTRRLSLTEAGRAFYEGCQRMLAEAEGAEAQVTALAARPRGVLRLSAPMSFGLTHLTPLLGPFLEACPELQLDLVLGDRVVDLVEEGFDAALRIGSLGDSSLIARRLCGVTNYLCAAPDYLRGAGLPLEPQDLRSHDCLLYSYARSGRTWSFQNAAGTTSVEVTGRVVANNGDALLSFAEAGQGIVCLPSFFVAPALRAGRLLRLLPAWDSAEVGAVYLVYPARRNAPPKLRALLDYLVRKIDDPAPWETDLPQALDRLPQFA